MITASIFKGDRKDLFAAGDFTPGLDRKIRSYVALLTSTYISMARIFSEIYANKHQKGSLLTDKDLNDLKLSFDIYNTGMQTMVKEIYNLLPRLSSYRLEGLANRFVL